MNNSPWAKLTTSMMPKINVNPEATSARIIPVTMPLMVWISSWSHGTVPSSSATPTSHSHVLVNRCGIGAQLGRGGVMPHEPLFDNVDARARLQRQRHVLLNQQ